jgi:hypothetical protein
LNCPCATGGNAVCNSIAIFGLVAANIEPTFTPMKLIGYSMAFLILLLSCLPCQDVVASYTASADRSTTITKESKEAAAHDDNCSPFCHCTCCAASSINQSPIGFHCISFKANLSFSVYVSSKITGIASPIWQPPQLV